MLDNEEIARRRALHPQDMSVFDSYQEYVATGNLQVLEDEIRTHPDPEVARDLPRLAFANRDLSLLEMAFRIGVSFQENEERFSGESYLCDAIQECGDHPEIVRWLLEHGAHPHRRTMNGWTPLHLAAMKNCLQVIRVLLDAGANIEVGTVVDGDYSPLMEACRVGATDAIATLLEYGADATRCDQMTGCSLLNMARQEKKAAVVALIEKFQKLRR